MTINELLQVLSSLPPAQQRALRYTTELFLTSNERGFERDWVIDQLRADAEALQDIATALEQRYEEAADE